MYRQIIVPGNDNISLKLPPDFIGHKVEVLAFKIEEAETSEKYYIEEKYSWENAEKFFRTHSINLRNFKFSRDEANER